MLSEQRTSHAHRTRELTAARQLPGFWTSRRSYSPLVPIRDRVRVTDKPEVVPADPIRAITSSLAVRERL